LLLAYAVNACANALPATLFLLYVEHRLGAPQAAGTLLLTYFIFGIAALPLWLWLAGCIGAARSWRISLYVACAGFVPAMFLGAGDVWLFVAVCAATGACLGADLALPASLQAEVAHRHGHAGALFAAWGMASKLALALAAGVALPLLSLSGFEARANDDTLPLALLYAAAPIPIKLIAARLIGALVEEENHASTQSNFAAASRDAARERV
jgi:Na+/melibiose symporter-like transporter